LLLEGKVIFMGHTLKGNLKISDTLKRKGIKPPSRKGLHTIHSEKTKQTIRQKLEGHSVSDKTRERISGKLKGTKNPWVSERMKTMKGEKNYSWKGGKMKLYPILFQIRRSFKYRQWRSDIFTRDNFTCQDCGKRGGDLEAHHIEEFYKIIEKNKIKTVQGALACEELWNLNNGRTLCRECHKKTKKGRKK